MKLRHFIETGRDEGHYVILTLTWQQERRLLAKFFSENYFKGKSLEEIDSMLVDFPDTIYNDLVETYSEDMQEMFEDKHYGEEFYDYPEED